MDKASNYRGDIMTYILKVSDNNGVNTFGPYTSKRDAVKERTGLITAYGYKHSKGFQRENDGDTVIFRHAIYSTVIFQLSGGAS